MGVVWGEGPASEHGPLIGADVSYWISRLVRTLWRRVCFGRGGDL